MTLESGYEPESSNGNDATTEFPFTFIINKASDLVVTHVSSAGVETVLTEGSGTSNYSINVSEYPGNGSITYPATLGTALATGDRIVRSRQVEIEQQTDLVNQGAWKPEQVEAAFDLSRMIDQQQQDNIDRSVKLPISSQSISAELPAPVALKSFRWNAAATALEQTDDPGVSATAAAVSAAAALVSENNASTSETNASASETAAVAAALSASANEKSIGWTFSDTTTMADPGSMTCRLNNAAISSVTAISVDALDVNGLDVSDYVAQWGASSNTIKGTILIRKVGDDTFFAVFNITAAVTDSTGWLQITVAYVAGSGTLTDGDSLFLHYTRAGDAGSSGGGSGDLVSTNNLSDLDNAGTARTNLGLGSLATANSASTSQVNDNAITLAKMAGGTDGNLITYDSNGDPAHVATGTAGQVLTSNGTGAAPTMQALPSASDVVLIESITLSSDASVEFLTGLNSYSHYRIEISNVVVSALSALSIQISADGGSSYNAVAYDTQYLRINNGTVSGGGATGAGGIALTPTIKNISGNSVTGFVSFGDLSDTTGYKHFNYRISCWENGGSGDLTVSDGAAWRKSNAAVNAIKFSVSPGSMTTGTITLYGYKTS